MNIILTGIARSGTTLTCSLLNKLPNCIALHEPIKRADLAEGDFPDAYLNKIAEFFASQRDTLLASGIAITKARDGSVPDNPFDSATAHGSLRPATVKNQSVFFNKKLKNHFSLVVKHPNMFTATLSALKGRFPCYAIVRNPLAVLLSWHSIQAPVNNGRIPAGELFDANLKSALSQETDRIERQIIILKWYFSQYASHLLPEHVIKYEEIVASGGRVLSIIDPDAALLAEQLKSRNASAIYDAALVDQLANRLLEDDSICGNFYVRSDIESLCAEWI